MNIDHESRRIAERTRGDNHAKTNPPTPGKPARWKYRIDVSNPMGCLMMPYSDEQAMPIPHAQIYSFHLCAMREARLDKVFCDSGKPGSAIAIRVNGRSYDPVWLLNESGINYATQLVPRAALVMSTDGAP